MITVIDSGIANVGSVVSACDRIGVPRRVTTDPASVASASALILPGVGAFSDGMDSLRRHGLVEPICEAAAAGIPILGICLGMQLLTEASEEYGDHEGLGLIAGRVTMLQSPNPRELVPNIGWCDVTMRENSRLSAGIEGGSAFYFAHSYQVICANPEDSVGSITFGTGVVSVAVEYGNIFGVQFHPERSQDVGLMLLDNFAQLLIG